MTATVIAGQSVALLSQWYDFDGGSLTDLDAEPTISIVHIGTAAVALTATSAGVTHPGTGSYGYAWTPASNLTPGDYLATWSGLKAGAPVTAAETITVIAPASTAATNTSPDGIWYATREDVMRALDFKETARATAQIDRALESASRSIESLCHRTFYPMSATRYFDWPNSQRAVPWRLWLDANELISVTALSSGGTTIPSTDYLLEPVAYGPPYNQVQINLGTSSAFGGGSTHQRDISITGLYGYRDAESQLGATVEALDASETGVDVDGATSAAVGVGSILRIDSERVLVTDRAMLDTGQDVGGAGLTAQANSVTVAVASGAAFARDEVILIDAERMLIVDIAGNSLVVKRAWDGSVLAAHTAGASIYAARTLTVRRGALGTTLASHSTATPIHRWDPPGPIRQLAIAEALLSLQLESTSYSETRRVGDASERRVSNTGLADLRTNVRTTHGRMARIRGV